jgi:hypothetical protein
LRVKSTPEGFLALILQVRRSKNVLCQNKNHPQSFSSIYFSILFAGLVRNAGSIALGRARADGSGVNGLLITLEDVLQALDEVKA